jgi:demethylmenaquinone methyltransferase/2-methoxy-6-polyprenyl-1,4-benzoquinol methylase
MSQREAEDNLAAYYAARAAEYDDVYRKPERQNEIGFLRLILSGLLSGHSVLEIACGTGFWTEEIAATASCIHATDVNDSVLEIASERLQRYRNVTLAREDAFALTGVSGVFTAAFACFWWSHLRRGEQVSRFLHVLHAKLQPGALVVFVDNRYVEGSSLPITRKDADGNTYQNRRLRDGTDHEVLKNFPEEAEFRSLLQGRGHMLDFRWPTYYWVLSYRTDGSSERGI